MPLPDWLVLMRPEWIPLVLIYWIMALPYRVGLGVAWIAGFLVDVLEGSLLGLNGLCYVLVAWLCISLYQRLRMFTLLQQSCVVFVFIGIIQILNFWILAITGLNAGSNLLVMLSALTSAVVWPFVFVTLRKIRRTFKVT
jgi:rod shape-determining protein MreD